MRSAAGSFDAYVVGSARQGAILDLTVKALVYASVLMLFLISAQRLAFWGLNYGAPGGSPLAKIHPGDWTALCALVLASFRFGNPIVFFNKAARWTGLTFFFVSWSMLFIYIVALRKTPFTPIVDTFLLPMVLFILIVMKATPDLRRLALLIHLLMTANGLLGLIEFLTGWRLTPFVVDGHILNDWRSTAFLGHPLFNASITGAYVLALALGGGQDLKRWLRAPALGLQLCAMVAFGGRASLILVLLFLFILASRTIVLSLRGARIPLTRAALYCFAAPLIIAALLYAAKAGFFSRFLERFINDHGSAEARVIMMQVFAKFPARQILFGPDQSWLTSLQYEYGISYGIESFWISFILEQGLIMSLLFFFGLAAFCFDLIRATRPAAILMILFFFIDASTSISLSAKSCMFAIFVLLLMVLLRQENCRSEAAIEWRNIQ